jgi:hypothetical protein
MSDGQSVQKKLNATEFATVVAGWATALLFALGLITFIITFQAQERFNESQRRFNEKQAEFNEQQQKALTQQASFQADTAAIDALRAYFAAGIESAAPGARQEWLTNDAFFTAETLFNLRSDNGGWRETAKGLILNHRALIDHQQFDCEKYSTEFVEFVRNEVVKKEPCRKSRTR